MGAAVQERDSIEQEARGEVRQECNMASTQALPARFEQLVGLVLRLLRYCVPLALETRCARQDGEAPEIQTIGGDGPDLGDTESLKYFSDKLQLV